MSQLCGLHLTQKGKKSITEYKVLNTWKIKSQFFSLLEITLHTGRTHQIRVTMAGLGHPVAGMCGLHQLLKAHNNIERLGLQQC